MFFRRFSVRRGTGRVAALLGGLPVLAALIFAGLAGAPGAAAAPTNSITLLSPSNTTVAESDDYATQVLGRPWDMSTNDQLDYLVHFTPPTVANGIWSATSTQQGASIFLQHQGLPGTYTYLGERDGVNYPIDTRRFTHLRVRMYSSVADRIVVWWFAVGGLAPVGNSNFFATQAGWHVYDLDLQATGYGSNGHWQDQPTVAGMRFDPIFSMGHPGANIQIDWARLTPASGPTVSVTWRASGNSPVSLYLSHSSGGADEAPIATGLSASSGHYSWTANGLAPGSYYIHAVMGGASSYSGPLVINQAPVFDLTAPSPSSGEDFASTVMGMPWSMASLSQFQTLLNLANVSLGPGYIQATGPNVNGGHSDPQLWFLHSDAAHQIDTNRYHYATYKLWVQAPPNSVDGQYAQWNLGPRVIWTGVNQPWQQTLAIKGWYNRWLTVATDLRTVPREPDSRIGWVNTVWTLRVDPNEEDGAFGSGVIPPFFRLGEVRLTADPTAQVGSKTLISWQPGKQSGTVTLYYNTAHQFGGTAFAQVPLSAGGYVWTVPNLAGGHYWISARADDGVNQFNQTALVSLTVQGSHPCPPAYGDVPPAQPFYSYIRDLSCANIAQGYSDNTFRPNYGATRAMLAEWIVTARGWAIDTTGGPHFADVPTWDPFYPYIETAYHHSVISGYADGTFHADAAVTRGQMSKMIVNAMGWAIDTRGGPHFADVPAANAFYAQIETIANHGIVSGYADGTFHWGTALTRGQLAKVLSLSR